MQPQVISTASAHPATCFVFCMRKMPALKHTWNMGASASLLTATMHLESFMPARCWMAPEIPRAMYRSGATTLPVCPTCAKRGPRRQETEGAVKCWS